MNVYTGAEFIEVFGEVFYRWMNKDLTPLGYTYPGKGLAIDSEKFDSVNTSTRGGMYFVDLPRLFKYRRSFGPLVAKISIPKDAKVCDEGDKFKADRIYIEQIMTLQEFCAISTATALQAVRADFENIRNVPKDLQTPKMFEDIGLRINRMDLEVFQAINPQLQTMEICVIGLKGDSRCYQQIRPDLKTPDNIQKFIQANYCLVWENTDFQEEELLFMIQTAKKKMDAGDYFNTDTTATVKITKEMYCKRLLQTCQQTEAICMEIVQWCPMALEFVVTQTQSICDAAWEKDDKPLKFIKEEFQILKMWKRGLVKTFENYQYVPRSLRTYDNKKEFIKWNPYCVVLMDKPIQMESSEQNNVPAMHSDGNLSEDIMIRDGDGECTAVDEDPFDESLVLFAIQESKRTLKENGFSHNGSKLTRLSTCEWFLTRTQQTHQICKELARWDGLSLQYMDDLFKDETVYRLALTNNGMALEFVSEESQTARIITYAISQNLKAFRHVTYKTPEICQIAYEIGKVNKLLE